MNIITDSIRREREYQGIFEAACEQLSAHRPMPMLITGLCDGARFALYASLISDIKQKTGKGMLIIVPDEKDALRLYNSFSDSGISAMTFPMRDFIFHNITASHDYEHERLAVLSAIVNGKYDAVIATPDAALQYTMPTAILRGATKKISANENYDVEELVNFLANSGYARVDMVDGTGQFSRRGGILDIFPPQAEYPVRIDFFDNEIEQMGIFDIMTQRRIENIESADITPVREVIITPEKRAELKKLIIAQLKKAKNERSKDELSAELEAIAADTDINFADKYISFIYPEKCCLFDYFSDFPLFIAQEYNSLAERITAHDWHSDQTITALLEEELINPKYADFGKRQDDFSVLLESKAAIIVDMFASGMAGKRLCGLFNFTTKQTVSYADNFDLLKEDMKIYTDNGYSSVLLCENETVAKNTRSVLAECGTASVISNSTFTPDIPNIMYGKNYGGFELSTTKFVCMSLYINPNSLSRTISKHSSRTSKKSSREKIMSYADLEVGDFVVHAAHGIGMYLGLDQLTVDGVTRDFVKIKYAGTDMLYLPTNQLDMVSKYIGAKGEDGSVKLSRIGGAEWGKAKASAKKAAKDMAKELIKLYAERMRHSGFAFAPDDEYQREFDSSFEYEETDGQLEAIDDIKHDMEQTYPMDRLLCGDVGFGKTEVALRAAFKAVANGKQVALLVPTTILAMQHFQTLLSRMRGFPINIDMLSRFRTTRQQAETIRKLRRGEVDIIVGTHRVVSKDVAFKNLGLVIIDEEQRFGVAQKEKLKQLSNDVDVLTLTATPIPRTLNMAMSGIRDMSVLEEAPSDRMPVQTYVLETDDIIIAEALRKEIRRGGQVFYLHNRVETIYQTGARIQTMVPDARIAVAHGQMDKEELSDIWRSMVVGETDILISTTIIETGIDVPNANTLIIDDADKMGLSQLHQLRGRVGRSSRRAYAYFTFPKGKALSEIASKRLAAIRDYTEFGSGFKIALRDLEIRGAGNLLGSEQHGHIESVGYDLYMKILNEAIIEEKGETLKPKTECVIDLKYDAFISEKYVKSSTQRIDAYKKIASIENNDDYRDVTDELLDRYGDLPRSVLNLLDISLIRSMGGMCDIMRIESKDNGIIFTPKKFNAAAWTKLAAMYKGRLLVSLGSRPYVTCRIKKDDSPLAFVLELLKKYLQFADEKM